MNFNPNVHEVTDQGDPARTIDGELKLKKRWALSAVDRQGRNFNKHVHGDTAELDEQGYLKVRRRKETQLVGRTIRTEAFVKKYAQDGYMHYVMNDEPGRMEQFLGNDWEPVTDGEGVASMKVGQARDADTRAVLMRKPIEWYEEDQRKKRQMNEERFKQTISPNEAEGQYEANPSSPLR